MKHKFLLALVTLLSLTFTSCGDEIEVINNHYHVSEKMVSLDAKNLITETQNPFSVKTTNSVNDKYEHIIPQTFTAYVVANETKGQYTTGQVIKSIQVAKGMNQVSLPEMSLSIYVTNYDNPNSDEMQPNSWYTWNDNKEQLPMTTHNLFYVGSTSEDFSTTSSATVNLENPYAAVLIKKNNWVSSTPSSHYTNQEYFLDTPTQWYIIYTRGNNTNTKVPINIPGNPNQNYTLSRTIEPNKEYLYTINGNVLEDDGNLNIIVAPIDFGGEEEINL